VRLLGGVRHSCPHLPHNHHAGIDERGFTVSGVRVPLRLGCHSRATFGYSAARLVAAVTRRPEQNGQSYMTRLATATCHSCPAAHRHHTRLLDAGDTSSGVSGAFAVGCQVVAISGCSAARLRVTLGRRPEHTGHPLPFRVRFPTMVCHSCPRSHCHHTRLPEAGDTSSGVSGAFAVGCQVAATSGYRAARLRVGLTRRTEHTGHPVSLAGAASGSGVRRALMAHAARGLLDVGDADVGHPRGRCVLGQRPDAGDAGAF